MSEFFIEDRRSDLLIKIASFKDECPIIPDHLTDDQLEIIYLKRVIKNGISTSK